MIAKVQRHGHAEALEALLLEIYQPRQRGMRHFPYLIGASREPVDLTSGHGRAGVPDIIRLAEWLNEPLARLADGGYQRAVWHCTAPTRTIVPSPTRSGPRSQPT
jgi:hypothetical protein